MPAFLCCAFDAAILGADSMLALAEDHLNDVISNICAIGTAAVAYEVGASYFVLSGCLPTIHL